MNNQNKPVQLFKPHSPESATVFNMITCGNTENGAMRVKIGEHDFEQNYTEISSRNSRLSFTALVTAKDEVILEIFETHKRFDKPISYFIKANGKRVYNRTYAPSCDGPNHYFIRIKGTFNDEPLNIEIISDCDNPIRINQVYLYCDGLSLAEKENVDTPMLLGLFSPGLSGDEKEDIRRINECRDAFAPYPVICGWDIFYCHSVPEQLHKQLDYILHLSSVTGIPMSFDLNSWWGGTPSGMDGLGGNFRDLQYQQVVYDPINATGYGVYQLTTPNYWKSLPWLSLNNEHYNKIRQERLKDASNHIKMRVAEYKAIGKSLPQPVIFTENEPDYWHYGAWHDSADGIVGIEPCALEAAKKQGVIIEPEKGLDENGKAWLWKNLTDYIVGVGNAIAEGIGNDITVVKDGKSTPPSTLLTEHSYTHATTGDSNYPYPEGRRSLSETHLIKSLRLGFQGGVSAVDPRPLEYATCYGKLAGVNKEQLKEPSYGILPGSYTFGADFQTIFNYKHCFESLKNAPKPADYINEPFPLVTYNDELIRYNFDSEESLILNETLLKSDNMHLSTARGSRAVRPTDNQPLGSLVIKIHSDNGFETGLITDCVATVNAKTTDTVELGYSPDEFIFKEELIGRHQYINSYMVDWSDKIDKNATDIYIRITMPSGLNATEYNAPERNSICSFVAYSPRPYLSGHTEPINFTHKELRLLHRLSERREDARRILSRIENSAELEAMFSEGLYQTVYDKAIAIVSQKLPAEYLVYNNGKLGNYPIEIKSSNPVRITILESLGEQFKIKTDTINHKDCDIEIFNYTAEVLENNIYLLTPANSNSAISLKVEKAILPEKISGRIAAVKGDIINFQSQNTKLTFYANSIPLKIAANCNLFVAHHGTNGEKKVEISEIPFPASATLITNGEKITEIHAILGEISGKVTSFSEACIKGEIKNPIITINDGSREVTAFIGSECTFQFEGATGTALHTSKIGDLGLKIGQEVILKYYPEIDGCSYIRAAAISDIE